MFSSPTRLLRVVAAHPMTRMRTDTQMPTLATNLRAVGKRFQILMRLGTKRGVSISRVTVAASNKSRRSRFHKLTLVMPSVREATLNQGARHLQLGNRSRQLGQEGSLAQATSRIRCKLISTITTCRMKRSKLSAHNRLRNEIWCNNPVTVTMSDNLSHQMTELEAKSTLNSKSLNPRPSSIKQLMLTPMGQKISKNHLISAPFCTY